MTALGDDYTPTEARLNRIFDRLTSRITEIIVTSAENQAKDISAQLAKAKSEIDGLVSSLEGSSVDQATLDQLKATSQALDDIVPDQVDQPPTDQPGDTATNETGGVPDGVTDSSE